MRISSDKKHWSGFQIPRKRLRSVPIYKNTNSFPQLNLSLVQYSRVDLFKNITFPRFLTPQLAEEIGIHYGDGFLSKTRNEFRVKGHKIDERTYYDLHIKKLYKSLFNINLPLKDYEDTYGFELTSKALWTFKTNVLGITPGRKTHIRLPELLKTTDLRLTIAFLRGLFDTDGTVVFASKYGYEKYYPKIEIWQRSTTFAREAASLLQMLGFEPLLYSQPHWDGLGIFLYGYYRFSRFYHLIGFHNPKHLARIKQWQLRYPDLSRKVLHLEKV